MKLHPRVQSMLLASIVGLGAGAASAGFLAALGIVTGWREGHSLLIFSLPISGLSVGLIYHFFGRELEAGNDLLIDEIHEPRSILPWRMAPLVLVGTLLTHLCGGSAGREGTAVQMGGALADRLSSPWGLGADARRRILMAGLSAGFGSVFGVPWAGAIFGLEVLRRRQFDFWIWAECVLASWIAHWICLGLGIQHTHYFAPAMPIFSLEILMGLGLSGILFGLMAWLFARFTHALRDFLRKWIRFAPFRPLVGGAVVVAGYWMLGTDRFAGLGIPVIQNSLVESVGPFDFAWKTLFTALTLGSGFKGGEVTPLLFIGATLGNSLASVLTLPVGFFSALGLVAVFAGAANTPIACTVMAMEIFGYQIGIYAAITCGLSYLFSGRQGIYVAQRRQNSKWKFLQRWSKSVRS